MQWNNLALNKYSICAEVCLGGTMNQPLIERIHAAALRCKKRLGEPGYRQLFPSRMSDDELQSHGPRVIEEMLVETIRHLCRNQPATTPQIGIGEWRDFLTEIMPGHIVAPASADDPPRSSFAPFITRALWPRIVSNKAIMLMLIGYIFQREASRRAAETSAWNDCAFHEIYHELVWHAPFASSKRHDAAVTLARCLAYCLCTLENASTLEDLRWVKRDLEMIRSGAVPIAYDPSTKTVYLGNWYTL